MLTHTAWDLPQGEYSVLMQAVVFKKRVSWSGVLLNAEHGLRP